MKPQISIIIPARDEEANVEALYQEILSVMKKLDRSYEIVFIDDGSEDQTFEQMKKLHLIDGRVKVLKLRGNFGKATALQLGFDTAEGAVVLTMDADLQDNPAEIPALLDKLNQGYDLVSGWKKERHDPLGKVLPSRILNWVSSILTGVNLHDVNCGFKIYRSEVIKSLNIYGELYRFIPIIAAKQRFKVGELIVDHRARRYGRSKYGIGRTVKGLLDLLTVVFLTGFTSRPGHFFGILGLISFSAGFVIGLFITYLRITTGSIQYRNPLLFLGILLMIVGIQLISTGLLAEMVLFTKKKEDLSSLVSQRYG